MDEDTIIALITARMHRYRAEGKRTAATALLSLLRELQMAKAIMEQKQAIQEEQAMERDNG